jgi:quercetin dioxygenase-like cupin family protein
VRPDDAVRRFHDVEPLRMPWGELRWLASSEVMPGALQTFGVVTINPGHANPLHMHPNCEELLYVLHGRCSHRLGDDEVELGPGELIHIPAETPHHARCTSDEPLVAVISFSSPLRETVSL